MSLGTLFFLVLAHYHWQHVSDDAFIAFRYVRNLLAGQGPVWNPGERVEGFSSPLWLGLLAAGGTIGLPLTAWAGGMGVFFLGLTLFVVHRTTEALCNSRVAAAAACVAATLIYPLHYWAAAGLETTLFVALLTAAVWSLVVDGSSCWAPVAAALGVARPEGPLLVVALLALVAVAHGRAALGWRRVFLACAPMVGWFLFRRLFYGDWLANTYYAKATGAFLSRIETGLLYASWAIVVCLLTAASLWLAGAIERKTVAVLVFLAWVLAIVVGEGGDWMWHARMVAPVLPALVALATAAIARATWRRGAVVLVVSLLAWADFSAPASLLVDALAGGRLPSSAFQEGTLAQASLSAASFIARHYPKEARVAVNHAGALPYALPNPAVDMTGLADWYIAHNRQGGVHQKFDAAYVLSRKPDLVVLNSATKPGTEGVWYHPGYWEGETSLLAQPAWSESYRPVDAFWEWHWVADAPRYIVLFERIPDR